MTRGTQDNEVLEVVVPGAFPGLFDPALAKRVDEILSNPTRPRPFVGSGKVISRFHALRVARCGFEIAPGQRCGRMVRATMRPDESTHVYRSACGEPSRCLYHTNTAPAYIDEVVLDVVREVFRPAALQKAAHGLRVDCSGLKAEEAKLVAEVEKADNEAELAGQYVLEEQHKARQAADQATANKHSRKAEFWKQKADRALDRVGPAQAKLGILRIRASTYTEVSAADLARIVKLGTDVPALIEASKTVPFALARLTQRLFETVWIVRHSTWLHELTFEFPSGAVLRRLVFTGNPPGSQPDRVWAAALLDRGMSPKQVAEQIGRAPRRFPRKSWDEETVRAARLCHQHFEAVSPREGRHLRIAELAERVDSPAEDVQAKGLYGMLGPARWDGTELVFCPSEAEVHRAFPDYALREVASAFSLNAADIIAMSEVRRANRGCKGVIESLVTKHLQTWADASGRRFIARKDMEARGFSLEPNMVEREASRQAVELAVRALGKPELDPANFVSACDLAAEWSPRFPFVTMGRIVGAAKHGRFACVKAPGLNTTGRFYPDLLFVHVPPELRREPTAARIRKWLKLRRV